MVAEVHREPASLSVLGTSSTDTMVPTCTSRASSAAMDTVGLMGAGVPQRALVPVR
jgi:hypothetical protein